MLIIFVLKSKITNAHLVSNKNKGFPERRIGLKVKCIVKKRISIN